MFELSLRQQEILHMDVRTHVFQNGTTGSSILLHKFGHRERGRRIQIVGSSGASSIVTWQQSNLEITPITLAAVRCDAEDPYSVNTAYEQPTLTVVLVNTYLFHLSVIAEGRNFDVVRHPPVPTNKNPLQGDWIRVSSTRLFAFRSYAPVVV